MYIYYDENDYVTGYGSEQEERSVQVDSIPEEVDRYLGCYRLENGQYILDEKRKAWLEEHWSAERELNSLEHWFKWYDEQSVQYQRAQRLGLEFDKDIHELDGLAVAHAARINQLRAVLEAPYSA